MSWSPINKVGLALLGIAAAVNLIPIPPPDDSPGPPIGVLIAGAVLGFIALVGVVMAWRRGSRKAAYVAIAVSVINALLAVPAFFVPDVPGWLRTLAGVFVGVTLAGITLTLMRKKAV